MISKLLRSEIAPLLAARGLQMVSAFAVSAAVVWRYGLESAGSLALSAFCAALGGHVICLGLQSGLPRAAIDAGAKATVGVVTSTLAALAFAPLIWLYAVLVAQSSQEAAAIAALAAAGALGGQNNVAQVLYVLQDRRILSPIMPALYLAGIGLATLAETFTGFALVLLATRIVSSIVGFAPLAYARTGLADFRATIRDSGRFAPLDVAGLLAEQLPIVLLSLLLTRAELGLIGLLRQFVTVADTPGFSLVFNSYPALVSDAERARPRLARQNERLSWIAAVCTFAAASLAAYIVYDLPILIVGLPIVLVPLPARYLANFCEQSFRAAGMIRDCVVLVGVRLVISLLLTAAFAYQWDFWGAVIASGLQSIVVGLLYRRAFVMRLPGTFSSLRPWKLA